MIDNYSPQEDIDNDDGSAFYHTHNNFLVYGGQGMKNDYGGHVRCAACCCLRRRLQCRPSVRRSPFAALDAQDNYHYENIYGYVGQGLGVCSQIDGHEECVGGRRALPLAIAPAP